MFDRFIVAVDDSEDARAAAEAGFDLAARFDAPVEVVHVLKRTALDSLRSTADRDRVREERESLVESVAERAEARDLRVSTAVLDGRPGRRIARYASQRPGSVVVLGRQGHDGVSRRVLGGVTERVLGRGTTPVLVHPGADGSGDFTGGPLLLPTDGSENARAAYPYATDLAAAVEVPIHLLGVLDLQQVGGVFNAGGLERDHLERLEADWTALVDDERASLATNGPAGEIRTAVRRTTDFDGVSGAIAEYADETGIGSVVMGSHGRSNVGQQLLGSVTRLVLRTLNVPVLVVPREE
jgi:nucleotide-binding universal stress UspA family protein